MSTKNLTSLWEWVLLEIIRPSTFNLTDKQKSLESSWVFSWSQSSVPAAQLPWPGTKESQQLQAVNTIGSPGQGWQQTCLWVQTEAQALHSCEHSTTFTLLSLKLYLSSGIHEPVLCTHTTLPAASQLHGGVGRISHPHHSISRQPWFSPGTLPDWGHTLCSVNWKTEEFLFFVFSVRTTHDQQKWPEIKNSNIGLWNRAIQIGKQRQSRKAFWAQDKRAFQAGNCQHCLHPLIWDNGFFLSCFAPWFQKGLPHGFSNGYDVFFDDCFFE